MRLAQKKLEKGSVWEKADANGDGVVSDHEMAMREHGASTTLYMWFSVTFIGAMTPIFPLGIDHLCIAEIFINKLESKGGEIKDGSK